MTKQAVIQKLTLARELHAELARQQAAKRRLCLPKASTIGGETFHRDWCKVYDAAVKRLGK